MKEHNEIDLLFQSALSDLELTPDPIVKENIDQAIASKKKRRRFLFILFPVLFGITGFAAILPFIQNEKQSRLLSGEDFIKPHTHRKVYQRQNERVSLHSHSNLSFNLPTNTFVLSGVSSNSETGIRTKEQLPQINTLPEKPGNESRTKQDTITTNENNPDSTLVNFQPDSINLLVTKALEKMGSNKGPGPWSLAVLTYWEGEKKRSADFENIPFTNEKRETARIHSSTFYGKIEINRQFAGRLELLTGIGFRSSKIVQYGYLERIEIPIESLGSGGQQPITPSIPDTIQWSEVQSFRTNSIVLPIGLAYSFPMGNKLKIRFSGGGEFAYGQITTRQSHPDLSSPKFDPFGFNIWLRPEIHYFFGRTQLFGFGTFDQALSQQLKWNFGPRRNPAFGGGIGLRINL